MLCLSHRCNAWTQQHHRAENSRLFSSDATDKRRHAKITADGRTRLHLSKFRLFLSSCRRLATGYLGNDSLSLGLAIFYHHQTHCACGFLLSARLGNGIPQCNHLLHHGKPTSRRRTAARSAAIANLQKRNHLRAAFNAHTVTTLPTATNLSCHGWRGIRRASKALPLGMDHVPCGTVSGCKCSIRL